MVPSCVLSVSAMLDRSEAEISLPTSDSPPPLFLTPLSKEVFHIPDKGGGGGAVFNAMKTGRKKDGQGG